MVFFCDISRRLGFVLWILVAFLYCIDLCFVLDSDNSVLYLTPATFHGLRFAVMASDKMCCVPGCGLDSEILHKFPNPNKDIDRFRTWLYNVGGDILAKDNEYIYKYRRVCHLHFEVKFHTRSKMLSANAVPTLNLTKFSFVKKQPLIDVTNQLLNIPPATPSTSGLSYAEKCSQMTDKTLNSPHPTPSTSGQFQRQDEPMDVDDLPVKTAHSVKSSTIKKRPGMNKQKLLKEIKKLQKDKHSYKQRLNKAKKLSTNSSFQNALKKFKTLAAIFTIMQFREISKPKMGRRFTKEEKIIALSMYKRGPRVYRWLIKSGFVLPSPVTLSRLVTRAGLKPGFNQNIFNQLHEKVKDMKEEEKLCTLIFDEMGHCEKLQAANLLLVLSWKHS
ncbi:uncharacterized protein [Maniola hyperantus]|uniref:uncharacterized protein n=1 Tax=Aphantopus hyperantus TaxID=2795564 RepID=UPI0037494A26